MSRALRVITVASLIVSASPVNESRACAVPHVATAAEIATAANVILLVRVPDVTIKDISPIEMSVLEILKGDFKQKTVTVPGQTACYWGSNEHPVPYDFVRLGGRWGNCFA